MKIKVSIVYLVLYVLGVITAGVLTGIYGNSIGIWISYGFLGVYGIMILINAALIEKISTVKLEAVEGQDELTPEQIKELPDTLGKGEEKKVGEATLETLDEPLEPPKEEPKKVQLSEEQIKMANDIIEYVSKNLKKGHKLEKIKESLEKAYTKEFINFVLENIVVKEPELPDMGEPEEAVTPEVKPTKKKKGRPKKKKEEPKEEKQKVEIVDPGHFK